MIRTVAEARQAVADEPKRWKVAVVEGTKFPLLEDPDAKVQLFRTKKGASDALREREQGWLDVGYKRVMGGLGRGFILLERDEVRVGLGLDYGGRLA